MIKNYVYLGLMAGSIYLARNQLPEIEVVKKVTNFISNNLPNILKTFIPDVRSNPKQIMTHVSLGMIGAICLSRLRGRPLKKPSYSVLSFAIIMLLFSIYRK